MKRGLSRMELGQRINTSLGEVIILDIKRNYLILFRTDVNQFIKANGYNYNTNTNNLSWGGGEYYQNFTDLVAGLEG